MRKGTGRVADNEKPASRLPEARYYLISAIMGALTGLAGTLFHLGVDGFSTGPHGSGPCSAVDPGLF